MTDFSANSTMKAFDKTIRSLYNVTNTIFYPRGIFFMMKILTVILLAFGSAPSVMFMVIPSWFLCVAHSIRNPEYAVNLPRIFYRHPPF